MTRLGPLVRREAPYGGVAMVIASLQFLIAMAAVQSQYAGYSLVSNSISDLGNPDLSPWAWLFNLSIRALGVLGVAATLLIRSAFPPRLSTRVGLGFLVLTSIGAFLVGTFPENSTLLNGNIHSYVSDLTFLGSGTALLFIGFAMLGDGRWELYGVFSILAGVFTFAAIAGFLVVADTAHAGVWERAVVAPILLWAIVAGAHIARLPSYARSPLPL